MLVHKDYRIKVKVTAQKSAKFHIPATSIGSSSDSIEESGEVRVQHGVFDYDNGSNGVTAIFVT